MNKKTLLILVAVVATAGASAFVRWQASDAGAGANDRSAVEKLLNRPEPVVLSEGTALKVRTDVTVSTDSHSAGDVFTATLVEPVVVGDRTVAPQGTRVRALVAESDPGGKVKGRAHLAVRLSELDTADWGRVEINTDTAAWEAKSTTTKDAAKVGAASGLGALVGAVAGGGKGAAIGAASGAGAGTAVVLGTRGKEVELPVESVLTFHLTQPVQLGS